MFTETHRLIFIKPAKRQLRGKVIDGNAAALIASVMTKGITVRGWSMETDLLAGDDGNAWSKKDADDGESYVYELHLIADFTRADDQKPGANEFASLCRTLAQRGSAPAFGSWILAKVDSVDYVMPGDDEEVSANFNSDLIGYAEVELPDEWDDSFTHLYGLNPHIGRIKMAIEAAIMSGWKNRFHCALAGPPGCGKSDICGTIKSILGEDAVMEFDATATTGAGAIKELTERDILPRILIVEEIEKAEEKALAFLLGVCDLRGEVRKTTARATIQRNTKMLVIATVNDVALFEKQLAGALASRFANQISFKRPAREVLAQILVREVQKIGGDTAWIAPTLDYCDDHGISDPRKVIALCLCGREKLVTGEYQKMLADTSPENAS